MAHRRKSNFSRSGTAAKGPRWSLPPSGGWCAPLLGLRGSMEQRTRAYRATPATVVPLIPGLGLGWDEQGGGGGYGVGCDLGDDGLQGLPGVFGAGGAAVRGAQIADEAGEVVQVPAQPVELDRG